MKITLFDGKTIDYPSWVCLDCGNKYGRKKCGVATFHWDACGICGKRKETTEPRDFGHLIGKKSDFEDDYYVQVNDEQIPWSKTVIKCDSWVQNGIVFKTNDVIDFPVIKITAAISQTANLIELRSSTGYIYGGVDCNGKPFGSFERLKFETTLIQ